MNKYKIGFQASQFAYICRSIEQLADSPEAAIEKAKDKIVSLLCHREGHFPLTVGIIKPEGTYDTPCFGVLWVSAHYQMCKFEQSEKSLYEFARTHYPF